MRSTIGDSAPERSSKTLERGVLVFRWVALIWMAFVAATAGETFRRPVLAWLSIGLAGAWTTWLTVAGHEWRRATLVSDLAICLWLLIASGLVVPSGDVVGGRPFFATGYPICAALFWGVALGPAGGLVAGSILSLGLVASRFSNQVSLGELGARGYQNLAGGVVNYLVAGAAVGLVSRLLVESAQAVQAATDELVGERERTARLQERDRLARHIHDSVLQALTMVHKRGKELSRSEVVRGEEVARLADMAADQEVQLRDLVLRPIEEPPTGTASLRRALEEHARAVEGLGEWAVSAVGPMWLPSDIVRELGAAVRQALENVARHAGARKTTVFADEDEGCVVVSIRDDGSGFTYDEQRLREKGKAGLLGSMKGRVEDLGGTMSVTSAPGKGTEVELRVPIGARES